MDESGLQAAVMMADAIASVCAEPEFYRGVVGSDAAHLVDAVLAAATSNDPQDVRIAIEALSDALRRAGHLAGVSGAVGRGPVTLARTVVRPAESVFLCPQRRCSRHWFAANHVDEPIPTCSASGLPLRERVL